MNKSVSIITDLDGIVIIQDLEYRFMMKMEIWSVITFFRQECL